MIGNVLLLMLYLAMIMRGLMIAANAPTFFARLTAGAVVLTFFERQRAGGGSPEWLARQRRKIEGSMKEIARLIGTREWAVGKQFSLGDIAAGTAMGYLSVRLTDLPLRALYPALAAYADRLGTRPSFASTVPVAQTITDKVV